MRATLWVVVCLLVVVGTDARAQQPAPEARRSAVVAALTSPISLDGVLDEPSWQLAEPIGDLIQR